MIFLIIGANSELTKNIINSSGDEDKFILISKSTISLKSKKIVDKFTLDLRKDKDFLRLSKIIKKSKPKNIIIPMVVYYDDDYFINLKKANQVYKINYLAVVKIINFLIQGNDLKYHKNIVLFGSISSLIGRNYNVYYSSFKRALDSLIESIIYSDFKNLTIHYYKLGYLDTQKNKKNNKVLFLKARLDYLSNLIIKNIYLRKSSNIFIYPFYWRLIIFIIKNIPLCILKRVITSFSKIKEY